MSRVTIRKSIYLKWGQLFQYATADHYKQVLTGSTERHKRTEVMLPRLVREGKLRTFKHGRVLVYAVPRYTQGKDIFVEHGLACTEGLVRFWRSTRSVTKACRAGASKALAQPRRKARTMICQACTRCVKVNKARMMARIIMAVWVIKSKRRRDMRSAMTPPYSVNNQVGIPDAKPTYPR